MLQRGPQHSLGEGYDCIRFVGMQDTSLVATSNKEVWSRIEAERLQHERAQAITEVTLGNLELDIENLPNLLNSSHPEAKTVLRALYRIGAFE